MSRLRRTADNRNRVGLDIGSHTIKGVELNVHGSETVIRAVGSVAVPSPEARRDPLSFNGVSTALRSLWSTARFEAAKVVLALPPEAVYIKWLNLDVSADSELDDIVRTTAARGAPFPAEDAVTDYRVQSSRNVGTRKSCHVMTVAASSPVIDALLSAVENAGLEPTAVDIGIASALRSFETQRRASNPLWGRQPRAHALIGARNTTVAVVRGGRMEFARTVPVGGNDITQCIVEAADVDWVTAEKIKISAGTRLLDSGDMLISHLDSEIHVPCDGAIGRLAREMQRSLRFFSSQFAEGSYLGMIGAITLSGGGALLKGIESCLRQNGIEVTGIINPFAGFSVDAGVSGIRQAGDMAAAYTMAVGLAIAEYTPGGHERSQISEVAASAVAA